MTEKIATIAALATVLAACGGEPRWAGTVRDSAGIAIVENTAEGMWGADDAPAIATELDIGTADGPPETQFGAITGVTADSDGNIYILDTQAQRVRVFDAEGGFLREMGGAGTGPGELSQAATGILRVSGDTIIVPDMMQQRVNRYAPDGTSAGSFPMLLAGGIPIRWDVTPDYTMVHQIRRFVMPGQASPGGDAAPAEPTGDPVVSRALDGTVLDTLFTLPPGQSFQMGGNSMRMKLFEAEPVWDLAPDGRMYSGMNDQFRIEVRNPAGELERILTLPRERRAVSESDRTNMLDMLREMMGEQGAPPAAVEQFLTMVQFADFYPAFATLTAGPDGQLWVQRIRSAESFAELGGDFNPQDLGADEWDIFDNQGRYLGVLELPARFTPFHVDGRTIYGVTKDDLDVQHVVRLRIAEPDV